MHRTIAPILIAVAVVLALGPENRGIQFGQPSERPPSQGVFPARPIGSPLPTT